MNSSCLGSVRHRCHACCQELVPASYGTALTRKVTTHYAPDNTVTGKTLVCTEHLGQSAFSREIVERSVCALQESDSLKVTVYRRLDDLRVIMELLNDNLLMLLDSKMTTRLRIQDSADVTAWGYRQTLQEVIGQVLDEGADVYAEALLDQLRDLSTMLERLPIPFFSVCVQVMHWLAEEENKPELPSEQNMLVNLDVLAANVGKYHYQRIGAGLGGWLANVAVVIVGARTAGIQGICQTGPGDFGVALGAFMSKALDSYNITEQEAVARMIARPAFVTSLNDGQNPAFLGTILDTFDGHTAIYMSLLTMARQFHIPEYVGMGAVMSLVKLKRLVCFVPEMIAGLCNTRRRQPASGEVGTVACIRTP